MAGEPETFLDKDGEARVRGVEFVFPVIIGTCAFSLGKKATDTETHRWTLYVRGPKGEDLSGVLSKVQFHLHPTFHNPVRTLTGHPFELTETGWGEFELGVTLHWAPEAGEPPIELTHKLKLYADDGSEPATAAAAAATPAKRPVVSEQYEEVIFSEPRAAFWAKVKDWDPPPAAPPLSVAAHCATPVSSAADVRRLTAARARVAQVRAALMKQLEQYGGIAGVPGAGGGGGGEGGAAAAAAPPAAQQQAAAG